MAHLFREDEREVEQSWLLDAAIMPAALEASVVQVILWRGDDGVDFLAILVKETS
jgi:hypothetical protein